MAIVSVDPQTPVRNYFPDATDVQGSLGNFLYWYDFSVARALVVQQGAMYAAASRPEAMVDLVVRAEDPGDNDMVVGSINGLQALTGHYTDVLKGTSIVGVPGQFTAFVVMQGSAPDVVLDLGDMKVWNTKVDTGGGSATYSDSAASGDPVILVVRWSNANGKVQAKVNDGDFVQSAGTLSSFNGNPSVVYVSGTTGPAGFDGNLGEVMLSPDYMDFAEMNAVGKYLCEKWQISWTDITGILTP